MNPKINKLRTEREKNSTKIKKLTARNEEIDQEITSLENTDIIGIVRNFGLSPDQLAALIQASKKAAMIPVQEKEEHYDHTQN